MKSFKQIINLLQMGETEGIAKRYMVMNSFDGALTALGIIIGSFLANVDDPRTLILAGLGASIAMAVSGGFGAYLTESAVKKEELAEIESVMLEEFDHTVVNQAATISSYFVAIVDGLSPFVAASFSFLPFFGAYFLKWPIQFAYISSVLFTGLSLFILGAYLGKISKENIILNGIRMIIAGVVTAILVMVLEFL
ncbi:MAG: VIT1/CCC1 transporter family protein [Candidatus Heimdallarchaeota archaeon]|nr:MAG: VIT1/CCC1 transporter family protein [Candidatus Heimdallarchaeota archaeon]